MNMSRITGWAGLFLMAWMAPALGGVSLVLPDKVEWSISGMADGRYQTFNFPADLPRVEKLSADDRKDLKARIRLIQRNQDQARRVGKTFFTQPMTQRLTPDYERNLGEVAISVSYADVDAANPLRRHQPLLRALPEYSRIHVITPTGAATATSRVLSEEGLAPRSVVHPTGAWNRAKMIVTTQTRATRWTRDTFMVGTDSHGKAAVFAPLAYNNIDDLANSDLNFLRHKWHDPHLIVDLPVFVNGGNVAVSDNNAGKRIVFFGADEVERNSMYFRRSVGYSPSNDLMPEVLKRIAAADHAVVLPNSEFLFHIDMAASFLAPGVVALLDPVDEWLLSAPDLGVVLALRRALPLQGFRVVRIPTTAARIKATQSSTNIVPYVDKSTGKRRALVPKFDDVEVTIDGRKQSLNLAIQHAYEAEGVEVVWVEDRFSDRRGNVHCALLGLH